MLYDLLAEIARGIGNAQSLNDGLDAVLRGVCNATDWKYGEAWLPDRERGSLTLVTTFVAGDSRLGGFQDVSKGCSFVRGVGLPGRVWESGQPELVGDVTSVAASQFPRQAAAKELGIRGALGVPILWKREVLGVLVFYTDNQAKGDPAFLGIARSAALSIGFLAHTERNEDQLREAQNLRTALPEHCVAEEPDSTEYHLVRYLYSSLRGFLPFDRIALATFSSPGKLHQRAYCATQADFWIPFPYVVQLLHSSLTTLASTQQPRVIDDFKNYMQSKPQSRQTALLLKEGYRSSLTIPLVQAGRVFGFLFFNSREPGVYRDQHVHMVRRLAGDIASLIIDSPLESSHLSARFADIVLAARRVSEEESLLANVMSAINKRYTASEVLNELYESCCSILPYDRIGYARIIEDGTKVRATWARSEMPVRLGLGFTQRMSETSLPDLLTIGTPRILNNLDEYLAAHPKSKSTQLVREEGVRSSLTMPLVTDSGPTGFLFFSSRNPESYHPDHAARLQRIAAQLSTILEKAALFEEVKRERERSDYLLNILLPRDVSERLRLGASAVADNVTTSVLFADLVGFTECAATIAPHELLAMLADIFNAFDAICHKHEVQKIRTIGDGYLAVAGLPEPRINTADRAAAFALALRDAIAIFKRPDGTPWNLRIGVSTGNIVAGVLGKGDLHYDVWGDTVNLASRLQSSASPGDIHICSRTAASLSQQFQTIPYGTLLLKGCGEIESWRLTGGDSRTEAVRGVQCN